MFRLAFLMIWLPAILSGMQFLDTNRLNERQKDIVVFGSIGTGLVYAGSMTALGHAWYKDQTSGNFRFFNDIQEWGGMDKLGHITTSWWISAWLYDLQQQAHLPKKGSMIRSAVTAGMFMTTIEVFDGFSKGYGFSAYDMLSNFAGIGSFYAQEVLFDKQLVLHRYSYSETIHARYRPQLLGNTLAERMLKNYNGQTYWVSLPIKLFLGKESKFPPWLCLSAGHSISGFLGGDKNPVPQNNMEVVYFDRIHQWKLSLDVDLSKLPFNSKLWKVMASTIRWIKIPAPVVMYSRKNGVQFYPVKW